MLCAIAMKFMFGMVRYIMELNYVVYFHN